MIEPINGIINAIIVVGVLIPFGIFITINKKADAWLERHELISALIGFLALVGLCYIIVAIFWYGWNTIPPTINEIVENITL